ncbi:hypothetical protein GTY75_05250 [Streptomyces sp. SID8381]|uniref:hypothetical protein n=1 Tax=unclassified Streptomyces TaxID=2593676 RepID=UPI000378F10C|nr:MULTISPECIES: hypothetical protein [unclassified Streptomyces]MYX26080.1 hypothetical protein [Streptomyces sp. SID8381]
MPETLTKTPVTHEGTAPADLIGRTVRVRPFYHVPESRSCLRSVRSPYAFEARVIEPFGEMVVVEFLWAEDSTPWNKRAAFYPKELHQSGGWYPICQCPACAGDGIHEHSGA